MMREDPRTREEAALEATVVAALERKPEVSIPVDFALRVAQAMPAKRPVPAQIKPVFGRAAGYVAVVAMMTVLLALSLLHPEALESGRGFLFAIEVLVVAQLLAVGLWLGMKSGA